jgi:hypothetical protein
LTTLIQNMRRRDLTLRIPHAGAVAAALEVIDPEPPRLPPPPERGPRPATSVHCMIIASHIREQPPSDQQLAAMTELAKRSGAELEVLENNHVCLHLRGESKQTVHRAASLALSIKRVLVDWMLEIRGPKTVP